MVSVCPIYHMFRLQYRCIRLDSALYGEALVKTSSNNESLDCKNILLRFLPFFFDSPIFGDPPPSPPFVTSIISRDSLPRQPSSLFFLVLDFAVSSIELVLG